MADADGNLMVYWDGPDGRWNGPAAVSGSGLFVPGGGVTLAQRAATPTQTDLLAIDTTGAIKVWSAVGSGHWQATDSIAPGVFAPGGHVAVSPQFGVRGQTDVFSVDVNGQIRVARASNGSWHQPPSSIWSPENFPPGAPLVASNRFGVTDQTDLYTVNNLGTLFALSVNGTGAWGGATSISNGFIYPQRAGVAACNQFGIPNQTDVFAVDWTGTLTVTWIVPWEPWGGPGAISPPGTFPPGAAVAASNQFGIADQTDVFCINESGALTVSWVVGKGQWNAPKRISVSAMFLPGSAVAACRQFGTSDVTLVFAISRLGQVLQYRVQGSGN